MFLFFFLDKSVRLRIVNIRIPPMGHGPVEKMSRVEERGTLAIRQRFVDEENVALLRKSMRGDVRCVVLRSVKEDSSALIQHLAIISGDTVGHWTAGPDKRFLSQSEIEIVCAVVLGPK